MVESIQKKLGRVRAPRVHITYDVEVGDAIQTKELPFVLGVIADLSGHNEDKGKLKDRKFVEIDPDNLQSVMKSIGPSLSITVDDKFNEGKKLPLELKFEQTFDFDPMVIIRQVESMNAAFEYRTMLNDVLAKLEGNDELEEMLMHVLKDAGARNKLKGELG